MPNLKKTFGVDPMIVITVLMVFAVAGLFALAAHCLKGNAKPVTELKSTTMRAVSAGKIVGVGQVQKSTNGNQLPDGSVILKVKMSDVKIRGMGLDSTNR